AIPFPRLETTPPVTNTYLGGESVTVGSAAAGVADSEKRGPFMTGGHGSTMPPSSGSIQTGSADPQDAVEAERDTRHLPHRPHRRQRPGSERSVGGRLVHDGKLLTRIGQGHLLVRDEAGQAKRV